jgi:hypothetical protein
MHPESGPFSAALDKSWLMANLHRYVWPANGVSGTVMQVDICRCVQSSRGLTLLYRLELKGPEGQVIQQLYTAYQPATESLRDAHESALARGLLPPALGQAIVLVPEAGFILLAFPNDFRMRLLSAAELGAWAENHLPSHAAGLRRDGKWQVQDTHVDTLAYAPGKRLTVRCCSTIATGSRAREVTFIAKQFRNREQARVLYGNLLAVGRLRPRSRPCVPRALGYDDQNAVVFMEDIPGRNLQASLCEIELPRVMPAVGGLLARLHRMRLQVVKTVSVQSELAEVRSSLLTIERAWPEMRADVGACLIEHEMLKCVERLPAVLLHGTCRLNHILIHDNELVLVDLDSLRMGHPAYDLANFLSSLYYLEALERISAAVRCEIARHVLQGYAEGAPRPVSAAAVLWFLASLLVSKQAAKCVAHLQPGRRDKVQTFLTLAHAALARARDTGERIGVEALWTVLP